MRYRSACGGGAKIPEHLEKVRLRLWTYGFWGQRTVLDLFSGMGCLSEEYAKAGCERLVCVEKDPEYFNVLQEKMKSYPNVELHRQDNMDWLEERICEVKDVTYIPLGMVTNIRIIEDGVKNSLFLERTWSGHAHTRKVRIAHKYAVRRTREVERCLKAVIY